MPVKPRSVPPELLCHSVDTLVSTYVGALQGDESLSNDRIETALTVR